MKRTPRFRLSDVAGFTLFEALVALILMGMILSALGAITAQWLPGWNRGFVRVQHSELFKVALDRLAADLSAAEFVTPNRGTKLPVFEGSPSGVTLVRSAIGPNTETGLEVVRITESSDRQGIALVRTRTRFTPFGFGDISASQLIFTDPVVLFRAPFRVSFSYSSGNGAWQDAWQNMSQLPAAVRFLVRDQTIGQTLAISSAAMAHVEVSVDCVDASAQSCGLQGVPGGPANAGTALGGAGARGQ
jgi:general secretion pathway protein J